jgi:sodium/bile acid cotransporter 7
MARPRFLPDNLTLMLIAVVATASILPCTGQVAAVFDGLTTFMIGLLFFMHGAKLSREAVVAGFTHWKLHVTVLLCTFAIFPLIGLALKPVLLQVITPELYLGLLFLCVLPSTVQSSIAFTSVARGNVPAAICAASASNLLGIFLTPLLVGVLVVANGGEGHSSLDSILKIVYQLLLPFVAGQIARRWIGAWIERNKSWLKPAGGLRRLQRGRGGRAVAPGAHQHAGGAAGDQCGAAGHHHGHHHLGQPPPGIQQGG